MNTNENATTRIIAIDATKLEKMIQQFVGPLTNAVIGELTVKAPIFTPDEADALLALVYSIPRHGLSEHDADMRSALLGKLRPIKKHAEPLCAHGESGPHEIAGMFEPGKPRHHGYGFAKCPGPAIVAAQKVTVE